MKKISRSFLVVLCMLPSVSTVRSMEVNVATAKPPLYIDQPVPLRVIVSDCEKSPQPECKHVGNLPEWVTVNLVRVSPRSSSRVFSYNGRVVRQEDVSYIFDFQVTATQPGKVKIGPFQVSQGNETDKTQTFNYDFQTVETDPDMLIQLVVPSEKIYVGQRVPIKIEWGYAGNLDTVRSPRIRSPLFDQFTFEDEPVGRTEQTMLIQGANGEQQLRYDVSQQRIDGRDFVIATMKRTLIAEKAGVYELGPVTASINKVTRWQRRRGFFDDLTGRSTAETVPLRSIGRPLKFEISPLPAGAPQSFAGAVGTGFRLSVEIRSSTIVNVGDPIKLQLMLQGNGNLAQAGLPPLSADGGLDPSKFRLPEDEVPGRLTDNGKEFIASIRVTDESVNQIPALAYAWFDPQTEKYETTRSKPLSLTVGEAQVVSSVNVVTGDTSANDPKETPEPDATSNRASKSQAGADLAIEIDRTKLLTPPSTAHPLVPSMLYVIGLAIMVTAIIAEKRREADPILAKNRKILADAITRIQKAEVNPIKTFATQVSTALRSVVPLTDADDRGRIEEILANLETVIYSPSPQNSGSFEHDIQASSVKLVEGIVRKLR